jgi:uncharacterized membrane protein YfcA
VPDLETTVLLFVAGFVSWTISTFSGGAGSIVLLAAVTHLIRATSRNLHFGAVRSAFDPTRHFASKSANTTNLLADPFFPILGTMSRIGHLLDLYQMLAPTSGESRQS